MTSNEGHVRTSCLLQPGGGKEASCDAVYDDDDDDDNEDEAEDDDEDHDDDDGDEVAQWGTDNNSCHRWKPLQMTVLPLDALT